MKDEKKENTVLLRSSVSLESAVQMVENQIIMYFVQLEKSPNQLPYIICPQINIGR